MESEWNTMPFVVCPHCRKNFQLDDYYFFDVEDSFYCPECEEEIFVIEKDIVTDLRLSSKP